MQKNKGFTLIELMVTLAVLGVIASLAAPSMIDQIRRLQLDDDAQNLQQFLIDTRIEAITVRQNKTFAVIDTVTTVQKKWKGKYSTAEIIDVQKLQFSYVGTLMTVEQAEIPASDGKPKVDAVASEQTSACINIQHSVSHNFKHIEISRLGMIDVIRDGQCT